MKMDAGIERKMERIARSIAAAQSAEAEIIRYDDDDDFEICICKGMQAGGMDIDQFIDDVRQCHASVDSLAENVVGTLVKNGVDAELSHEPAEISTSPERPGAPIMIERSVWVGPGAGMDIVKECLQGLGIVITGGLE